MQFEANQGCQLGDGDCFPPGNTCSKADLLLVSQTAPVRVRIRATVSTYRSTSYS